MLTIQDLDRYHSLKRFLCIYISFGAGYRLIDISTLMIKYSKRSIKHYSVDIERNFIYIYLYN